MTSTSSACRRAPEEGASFVADPSNRAGGLRTARRPPARSPHYGERWARHWLDLVRYAETNGFERDGAKPNAWRYRDYVIRSFNDDKPYDRFVREQLAGDELPRSTARLDHRHRLLPAGHLGRRAGRSAAGPLRRARRHRGDHRPGVPRPDGQLRPLPRPQDRPDPADGLLPAAGVLPRSELYGNAGDQHPPTRPISPVPNWPRA